ncbi:Uncharacterised protein [Vibrio cholerae]|nr:Uncharacterised protein [Vibrio cholerae]
MVSTPSKNCLTLKISSRHLKARNTPNGVHCVNRKMLAILV